MIAREKIIFANKVEVWTLFFWFRYRGSLRNFIIGFRKRPCLTASNTATILINKDQIPISTVVGKTFFARIIYPTTPKIIRENRFSMVKKTERTQNEFRNLSFKISLLLCENKLNILTGANLYNCFAPLFFD